LRGATINTRGSESTAQNNGEERGGGKKRGGKEKKTKDFEWNNEKFGSSQNYKTKRSRCSGRISK